MSRFLLSFFLLLLTCTSVAQKKLIKKWEATSMQSLAFLLDKGTHLTLRSGLTDSLVVTATMEGEYANDLHLGILNEHSPDWVFLTSFEAFKQTPNDKLAAHKVKSIKLEVLLPNNKTVNISGHQVTIVACGTYKQLDAQIQFGNIGLEAFLGNAQLTVQQGNIIVHAKEGVGGIIQVKRGSKFTELPETGRYTVTAQMGKGSVKLLRFIE